MSAWILPLINEVTALAKIRASNAELCLYRWGHDLTWICEVGNPTNVVRIGEVEGEFRGEGATLEEALRALIANLRADRRHK
jgi:hypothetical protein